MLRTLQRIIADEPEWRSLPRDFAAESGLRVAATRWERLHGLPQEATATQDRDNHVVAVALRDMNCHFSVSGRTVQDGFVAAGMMHVTEPAADTYCLFRGAAEALHLHVPNTVIAEVSRELPCGRPVSLRSHPRLIRDPVVAGLGRALLHAEEMGQPLGLVYAESVSLAIVTRLMVTSSGIAPPKPPRQGLAKWRLKRVIEFIETRLADGITLADMASVTALTPMYFAAQFRAATGLRPHEYLLRRRIEHAKLMMLAGEAPLIDVALSVGFQTQSHFTSVFKRFVGKPPAAWREDER
jgi:AraC family transcriptional regulator